MKKKNILTENWQIKLLAIITAIFLWFYIGVTRDSKKKVPVPPQKKLHSSEVIHDSGR